MEVAEQWGSLPLSRRAVTPVLSRLEQGGHCELGDKGQRTDQQSLPGHVGGESDTAGARLASRKTECSRGQGADARASYVVCQPGGSRASGGRKRGVGGGRRTACQAQRSGSGFAEKSPDFWRKGNAAQGVGRLSCVMQVGFRELPFP